MLSTNSTLFVSLLVFFFLACNPNNDPFEMDPDPEEVEEQDTLDQKYFPPLQHDTWDKHSLDSLEWDQAALEDLNGFLQENKTKGFMIIKAGKIAVEEYYNGHGINKNWNWYSAAKSLTSVYMGIAQKEEFLDINNKTSDYMGNNWSNLDQSKQDLITVKNHLSMNTGLNNPIGNFVQWTCTLPICFNYKVDAGTQWSYHQGAFTLSQDIITRAVGQNFKTFGKEKLLDKVGMNGSWNQVLDVRIFSSTTRSMARFGLLALNEGVWDNDTIYTKSYHDLMIAPSQDSNEAYGYLWWLNGQDSFLGPGDDTIIPGNLIPNGPEDMYCALGAQDQKIYVVPSLDIVVVRTGEAAGGEEFASSSFDNELWGKLSVLFN